MKLTLALAQINTRLGEVAANLQKHLALAEQAHAAGADLLVFPELSLTGYVLQDLASRGITIRTGSMKGLAEEAPQAYKNVDAVVSVVQNGGISKIIARTRPIGVIKG